jgi:hypothetical protein
VTKTSQTCFPNRSDRFRLDRQGKHKPWVNSHLCNTRSADSPNGLQRNFGYAWVTSWTTSPSKELHWNALNHWESQISWPNLKNSSSNENHQIGELSTGLEGQGHQEKRHKVLMCDSHTKSRKETPPKLYHKNPKKKPRKSPKRENGRDTTKP